MWFENDTGYIETEKVTMVGHVRRETEVGLLRLAEGMDVLGEKESRKTKENLERYSEEGFGTNKSG